MHWIPVGFHISCEKSITHFVSRAKVALIVLRVKQRHHSRLKLKIAVSRRCFSHPRTDVVPNAHAAAFLIITVNTIYELIRFSHSHQHCCWDSHLSVTTDCSLENKTCVLLCASCAPCDQKFVWSDARAQWPVCLCVYISTRLKFEPKTLVLLHRLLFLPPTCLYE